MNTYKAKAEEEKTRMGELIKVLAHRLQEYEVHFKGEIAVN
jgi:hypothetical protein